MPIHDFCHCPNQECPKADKCYRAFLAREDMRIKKEHPEHELWCSYSIFRPDEKGNCKDYLER